MDKEKIIYTRILERTQIEFVIVKIPEFIQELVGDCIVTAMYGCGSHLHCDLQYVPMKVGISWLDRFIEESIEQEIFIPSQSDFIITIPDERVSICFCHESDIHISGKDKQLVEKTVAHDLFKGLMK